MGALLFTCQRRGDRTDTRTKEKDCKENGRGDRLIYVNGKEKSIGQRRNVYNENKAAETENTQKPECLKQTEFTLTTEGK